jgi:hypothetical protein
MQAPRRCVADTVICHLVAAAAILSTAHPHHPVAFPEACCRTFLALLQATDEQVPEDAPGAAVPQAGVSSSGGTQTEGQGVAMQGTDGQPENQAEDDAPGDAVGKAAGHQHMPLQGRVLFMAQVEPLQVELPAACRASPTWLCLSAGLHVGS